MLREEKSSIREIRTEDVIEFYDNEYDEGGRLNRNRRNRVELSVKNSIYKKLIAKCDRVLQIGAGCGAYTGLLLNDIGCKVLATDLVPKHVEIISRKFPNSNPIAYDASNDKFPNEVLNFNPTVVLVEGAAYHMEYNKVRELFSRMKAFPNLRLILTDYLTETFNTLNNILGVEDCMREDLFYRVDSPKYFSDFEGGDYVIKTVPVDYFSRLIKDRSEKLSDSDFGRVLDIFVRLTLKSLDRNGETYLSNLSEKCVLVIERKR